MPTDLLGQAEYVIFDMDGLLNEILGRYGLEMTWSIKKGIMGKVAREACEYIYSFFPGLEDKLSIDEFMVERAQRQDELFRRVPAMTGAVRLVRHLYDAGVPIALATGSSYHYFKMKTSHLPEIFSLFPPTSILTADSPEVRPGRGKPNPDIFLAAAHSLGRDVGTAESCTEAQRAERAKGMVFEDAVPGATAGVAAGMNVIWIPDAQLRALAPGEDYGSKEVLQTLEEWDPARWGLPPYAA